jgi:hypothetical protein
MVWLRVPCSRGPSGELMHGALGGSLSDPRQCRLRPSQAASFLNPHPGETCAEMQSSHEWRASPAASQVTEAYDALAKFAAASWES